MEPTIFHFKDILRNTIESRKWHGRKVRTQTIYHHPITDHILNMNNFTLGTRMYEYLRNMGEGKWIDRAKIYSEAAKLGYTTKDIIAGFDELDTIPNIGKKMDEQHNMVYCWYPITDEQTRRVRRAEEVFNSLGKDEHGE